MKWKKSLTCASKNSLLINHQSKQMELNLLLPATETTPSSAIIHLHGHPLQLVAQPAGGDAQLPYTCVSFAWGNDRVPHPLMPSVAISARALPVLDTAIQAMGHLTAKEEPFVLWMDTFCIPDDEALKAMYLSRMGDIYAQAAQVLVVLSPSMQPLLQAIRSGGDIPNELLLLLNTDEWVTRAWTYQEIVNGGIIFFVAEGDDGTPIKGHVFFDAIANAIEPFTKAIGYDAYAQQQKLPGLTAFEAVVLDWRIAEYAERSAYQVMTNMCYRHTDQPNGLIYAMIGCISGNQPAMDATQIPPAELFMQVCEAKGDFSFIYTTDARSTVPQKSWRPADGTFRPVLPWLYCFGEGQAGQLLPAGLELQKVLLWGPRATDKQALENTLHIMHYNNSAPINDPLAHIRDCMHKIGFTGCGQVIEVQNGYFFPQWPIDDTSEIQMVVSTEIHWTFGAPGLLVKPMPDGRYRYQGVGVFTGKLSKGEETVVIV
jgi:hypothetical protein